MVVLLLLVQVWLCGLAVLLAKDDSNDDDDTDAGPWGGPFDHVADSRRAVVVVLPEDDLEESPGVGQCSPASRLFLRVERTTVKKARSPSGKLVEQPAVHFYAHLKIVPHGQF